MSTQLFPPELIEAATLTEPEAQRASEGQCPSCTTRSLKRIASHLGAAFHGCDSCGGITVLADTENPPETHRVTA